MILILLESIHPQAFATSFHFLPYPSLVAERKETTLKQCMGCESFPSSMKRISSLLKT